MRRVHNITFATLHPNIATKDEELQAFQQTTQYKRHCPKNTLLYQLVEMHYPEFEDALSVR